MADGEVELARELITLAINYVRGADALASANRGVPKRYVADEVSAMKEEVEAARMAYLKAVDAVQEAKSS